MRACVTVILIVVSAVSLAQHEPRGQPRLLRAQDLPIEVDPAALQRQYDALATMSLRSIEYSSQGSIQDIDGDTGVVLPSSARRLTKGDSGADVLQLFGDVLLAVGNEILELRDNTLVDPSTRNLTFSQSIRGIPVLFGVVSIEVNDDTRRVSGLTANFIPDRNLPSKPRLTAQQAEQIVPQSLEAANDARAKKVEIDEGTYLGYFVNPTESVPPRLVWVVRATLDGGDREDFFVDADTGAIAYRAQADNDLSRIVYDVNNTAVPYPNIPNQYQLTTQAQINANTTAKQAYDNVEKTNTNLSLRFPTAVGNFPQTVKIAVNWPFNPPNAKHGLEGVIDYLRFSGDSELKYSYGKPLNIVAHEFTHGFSQREIGINLTLSDNQAGALKESFSDIMATVVDIVDGADPGPDSPIWVHGHGIFKSGAENGLRSFKDAMADVRAYYSSHSPYSVDWFPSRVRGVSVGSHENSTILSHAYYLLVFGGTHARSGDPGIPAISVPAQTETRARNIFMRAFQDNSMSVEPNFL